MRDINIDEIRELDIPKYGPIFACVYDLFRDYVGVFFKLYIEGKEYILQRRDNLFVLYSIEEKNSVSYEMFTVDEEYKIDSAGFDDFELHTISGDKVVQERNSTNLETLIFIKRRDGGDSDGYDGSVGYIQYNQEKDMRLMLIYQQMYNSMGKVYSFHVNKNPFQIMFEKGLGAKEKGSILPVKTTRYIRCDYDEREYNFDLLDDFFVNSKDVWYLTEYISGVIQANKEKVVNKIIETNDKKFIRSILEYDIFTDKLCEEYKVKMEKSLN